MYSNLWINLICFNNYYIQRCGPSERAIEQVLHDDQDSWVGSITDPRKSGTFLTLSRMMKMKGLLISTSVGSMKAPLKGTSSMPGKKGIREVVDIQISALSRPATKPRNWDKLEKKYWHYNCRYIFNSLCIDIALGLCIIKIFPTEFTVCTMW